MNLHILKPTACEFQKTRTIIQNTEHYITHTKFKVFSLFRKQTNKKKHDMIEEKHIHMQG